MKETQKGLQSLGIESQPEDILPFPNMEKSFQAKLPGLIRDRDNQWDILQKLEDQRKKKEADFLKDIGNESKVMDLRDHMTKVFKARAEYYRILKEIAIAESIIEGKENGLKQEQLQRLVNGSPTSDHFYSYEKYWKRLYSGLTSGAFIHHMQFHGEVIKFADDLNPELKRIQWAGLDWKAVQILKAWVPEIYEQDLDSIARKLKADKKLRVKIDIPPTGGGPVFGSQVKHLKSKGEDAYLGQLKPRTYFFNVENLKSGSPKMVMTGDESSG